MQKKELLLVITHYRENNVLVDTLNTNKRIQKIDLQLYKDINNLFSLGSIRSGYRKNPHIYMDPLYYNHQFSFAPLLNFCKFIYLVNKPRLVMPNLIGNKTYSSESCLNYYCFRLRKIYEMIRKTPKQNFRVYFDEEFTLPETYKKIQEFLDLKEEFNIRKENSVADFNISNTILEKANECYEKYRFKIKESQEQEQEHRLLEPLA
jgi:hypothetical protein